MKIQLGKLVNNVMVLENLAYKEGLSRKMSYAIAKNLNKISKELEIYNAERLKLIKLYGEKDENGDLKLDEKKQYTIKKEYLEDWKEGLKDLSDIEIDIDIHQFDINDYYNCECSLTPAELMTIDYMIKE